MTSSDERHEPGDAASPAEREFIERVRGDRARAQAIARKAMVVAVVLVVALGALLLRREGPAPAGEEVTPAGHVDRREVSGTAVAVSETASPVPPPSRADEQALAQRLERLEGRLAALEHRVQGSATRSVRQAATAARPVSVKVKPAVSTKRPATAPSPAQPRRPGMATGEAGFGERVRRGWETVERQVKRVFAD